jgi:DNA-binding beta-propeller fold protein YncE
MCAQMFSDPKGLAVDPRDGTIYVSENHRLRKIAPGGIVSTLAGNDDFEPGHEDGQGLDALFNEPLGVALTTDGALGFVGLSGL